MGDDNQEPSEDIAHCNRMVQSNEIRWTLEVLPLPELLPASDLLALDPGDLLEYAFDLQQDLRSVRGVLHETLDSLSRVVDERDGALSVLREMRKQASMARRGGVAA